jgi:hypothetical protein
MNYCTPYPSRFTSVGDYLVSTLNILHPPRVVAGNQLYSAVKLHIHSLPWVGDLEVTANGQRRMYLKNTGLATHQLSVNKPFVLSLVVRPTKRVEYKGRSTLASDSFRFGK